MDARDIRDGKPLVGCDMTRAPDTPAERAAEYRLLLGIGLRDRVRSGYRATVEALSWEQRAMFRDRLLGDLRAGLSCRPAEPAR